MQQELVPLEAPRVSQSMVQIVETTTMQTSEVRVVHQVLQPNPPT